MTRHRARRRYQVALFPFVGILACVVGMLTLLMTAASVGQGGRLQSPETARNDRRAGELRSQIAAATARLATLQSRIDVRRDSQTERARAAESLQRRKDEIEDKKRQAEATRLETPKLLEEADRLSKQIPELQARISSVAEQIKPLRSELEKRQNAAQAEVQVLPGTSGTGISPTFVECTADGLVVHEGAEPVRITGADFDKSGSFLALLERVSQRPDGRLMFLVRNNGIVSYERASAAARARKCPIGKLPIVGQGNIDLTAVK